MGKNDRRRVLGAERSGPDAGYKVDMAALPLAPYIGYANQWAATEAGLYWTIQFSYRPLNGGTVAVATCVMDLGDVATMLGDLSAEFVRVIDDLLAQSGVDPAAISEFAEEKSSAAPIQIVRISRLGMDGLVEGYRVNPQSVVSTRAGKGAPKIEAMFAVSIQVPVLQGLLRHVAAMLQRVRHRERQ